MSRFVDWRGNQQFQWSIKTHNLAAVNVLIVTADATRNYFFGLIPYVGLMDADDKCYVLLSKEEPNGYFYQLLPNNVNFSGIKHDLTVNAAAALAVYWLSSDEICYQL